MVRTLALALVLVLVSSLAAQGIGQAKIKKLDLDKMVITLEVANKDRDFHLTPETRVFGAEGKPVPACFEGLKAGMNVMFKPGRKDGKDVLLALKVAGPGDGPPKVDTSKLVPLPELGAKKYQGFEGGFYPGGKNERPAAHEKAGLGLAKAVRPLDGDGKPSADGKVVLLSVGMSNTSQASQGFQKALAGLLDRHPRLVFVNGAQGGMTAVAIQRADDGDRGQKYWTTVDQRLKMAGATRAQVQVVWIKQANAGPSEGFPGYAQKLQGHLGNIVRLLPERFPNVKLVYLSGRTYGGYAKTRLNPEPYAYESGFAFKWLIEQQLKGELAKAPWLSWGPYLWANGTKKRADGFHYEDVDFSGDGTHLSPAGQDKVGRLMLRFFAEDTTTRPWFVRE